MKLIIILCLVNLFCFINGSIRDNLIKCYSPEEYPAVNEMPPLNVQLLVELLRKLEFNDIMTRDIRILTTILYHR